MNAAALSPFGASTRLLVVGLGLVAGYYVILRRPASMILFTLVGLAFGGSLISIFAVWGHLHQGRRRRCGFGGQGEPEFRGRPHCPSVIADNVGDNVGDCAGMAADLFETAR